MATSAAEQGINKNQAIASVKRIGKVAAVVVTALGISHRITHGDEYGTGRNPVLEQAHRNEGLLKADRFGKYTHGAFIRLALMDSIFVPDTYDGVTKEYFGKSIKTDAQLISKALLKRNHGIPPKGGSEYDIAKLLIPEGTQVTLAQRGYKFIPIGEPGCYPVGAVTNSTRETSFTQDDVHIRGSTVEIPLDYCPGE
jgi:hypothetical protein